MAARRSRRKEREFQEILSGMGVAFFFSFFSKSAAEKSCGLLVSPDTSADAHGHVSPLVRSNPISCSLQGFMKTYQTFLHL